MERVIAVLLLACVCQGCFALEELDKGQALLDQHSGRKGAEAAPQETPPGEAAEDSFLPDAAAVAAWTDTAKRWWRDAWRRKSPGPDPDDVVVHCGVAGATRFMRRSACLARGGRIL